MANTTPARDFACDVSADFDRSFYEQFLELRRTRLPVHSNVYDYLHDIHTAQRVSFERDCEEWNARVLPDASRRMVNGCFEESECALREAIADAPIPNVLKDRAARIFRHRLPVSPTLLDFRRFDIFDGILKPQDTVVADLFDERGPENGCRPGICHMFLHAPQQTRYMFFHEMAVGYFVNSCLDRTPHTVPPEQRSIYWRMTAEFIRKVADATGLPERHVAALHVADNAVLEEMLSPAMRDLATVCCHMYWYLELFFVLKFRTSTDFPLMLVLSHFAFPSLNRLKSDRTLTLAENAGELVDHVFVERMLHDRSPKPTHQDVQAILAEFVQLLWRSEK